MALSFAKAIKPLDSVTDAASHFIDLLSGALSTLDIGSGGAIGLAVRIDEITQVSQLFLRVGTLDADALAAHAFDSTNSKLEFFGEYFRFALVLVREWYLVESVNVIKSVSSSMDGWVSEGLVSPLRLLCCPAPSEG